MLNRRENNHTNIRNKFGNYNNLIKQILNEEELKLIFEKQKELGNSLITEIFENEFFEVFKFRKGLPSFEGATGECELEKPNKHAPKDAISACLFRAWQDLNNIKYQIEENEKEKNISSDDRKKLIEMAFEKKKVSESDIAKLLSIGYTIDDNSNDEKTSKIKTKKAYLTNIDLSKISKSLTFKSYHEIKKELESDEIKSFNIWDNIKDYYKKLDAIVYCIAYLKEYKNLDKLESETIKEIVNSLNFDIETWEHLFDSLSYSKTMSYSLNAIWKLLPHFEKTDEENKPLTIDKVLKEEYGNIFNSRETEDKNKLPRFNENNITNPIVKRALNQTRLVINKLISLYGKPSQINIELTRELGKSREERNEISKMQEENRANNERIANEANENNIYDITAYKLYKEQACICIYSGREITIEHLQRNEVEVDHILPVSRSADDSLANKVLTFSSENQKKGSKTAFEYISSKGIDELNKYKIRVNQLDYKLKGKKHRLLREDFDDKKSQEYKSRHLNDTRYITREITNHIDATIRPKDIDYGYVRTITGTCTSILRKLWEMGAKDRKESHKHHAMDAILIASCGESIKNWERNITIGIKYRYQDTKDMKKYERLVKNLERFGIDIAPPWETFSKDARNYVENEIFVSRMGKRKVSGQIHKETIMSKRICNGKAIVVKRIKLEAIEKAKYNEKAITDILNNMIDLHSDIDKNDFEGRNKFLYDIILNHAQQYNWKMDEAFNKDNAPTMPNSDAKIRRIKIIASASSSFELKNMSSDKKKSAVDSGDVIRQDLFLNTKTRKYEIIPIYPYHYNKLPKPISIDSQFELSVYKNDYLIFESSEGFIFEGEKLMSMEGYYNTASKSQIILWPNYANIRTVVGIPKINSIRKYRVDILGKKHLIKTPEKRLTLKEVEKKFKNIRKKK